MKLNLPTLAPLFRAHKYALATLLSSIGTIFALYNWNYDPKDAVWAEFWVVCLLAFIVLTAIYERNRLGHVVGVVGLAGTVVFLVAWLFVLLVILYLFRFV